VDGDDHSVGMWQRSWINILGGEGDGYMGPRGSSDRILNSDVVNLSVIITPLPLVIEIGVGASGYCKDCAMSGEGVNLLQRLVDFWWRW
jgi:hypothetical protein